MNEADTCREYVVPPLVKGGWDTAPHSFAEQRVFTDGRVFDKGGKRNRGKQKKANSQLRYTHEFPLPPMSVQVQLRLVKSRKDRLGAARRVPARQVAATIQSVLNRAFRGEQ